MWLKAFATYFLQSDRKRNGMKRMQRVGEREA